MTTDAPDEPQSSRRFLAAFHDGERWALEDCYRQHASRVLSAARGVVGGVDAETVTHEVFYRLLSTRAMREGFRGGNVGAWLVRVAMNAAIDDLRRRRREVLGGGVSSEGTSHRSAREIDEELEARLVVERFRKERLPSDLAPVFEARFLRQLSQRDAARELDMPRTTLVYQEQRIRSLLSAFVLERDEQDEQGEQVKEEIERR